MKRVLLVSDLHVGSRWGLFPAGFVGTMGAEVSLNAGQQYLLRCWQEMTGRLPGEMDYLILAGDIIEGQNLREGGRYLCEPDPQMQARAAAELFNGIRARHTYCLRGTPYHAGVSAEDEEFLAEVLGAEQGEDRRRTIPWLLLEVEGVLLDVAHRQSYTIRYRSMPLDREIGFLLERMDHVPGALCVVRAHTHQFQLLDLGNRMAISLPSWKIQDAFAQTTISPNRTIPRWIGAVELRIEGESIDVVKHLFQHPQPAIRSDAGGDSGGGGGKRGRRSADDNGTGKAAGKKRRVHSPSSAGAVDGGAAEKGVEVRGAD